MYVTPHAHAMRGGGARTTWARLPHAFVKGWPSRRVRQASPRKELCTRTARGTGLQTLDAPPLATRLDADAPPLATRLDADATPLATRLDADAPPLATRLDADAPPLATRLDADATPARDAARCRRAVGTWRRETRALG